MDQTRGWFYSLLAISTLLFKQNAYRNVICLGLVVDPKGKKAVEVARQRARPELPLRQLRLGRGALVLLHVHAGRRELPHRRRHAARRPCSSSSSRCGTATRSSSPTRGSTTSTPRSRPFRSPSGTCSTAGCCRGSAGLVRTAVSGGLDRYDANEPARPHPALRRRPVELVHPALAPPLLEVAVGQRQAGRLPDAATRRCAPSAG